MNRISEMPGYSATVRLRLVFAEQIVSLAQVAPEWVIARSPVELPAGNAQVVVEVDGQEFKREVYLPEGMTRALDTKVRIQTIK
jgi:hypothetical protein